MTSSPFPEIPDSLWEPIVTEPHNFDHRLRCAEHIRPVAAEWARFIEWEVARYRRLWAGIEVLKQEPPGGLNTESRWLGPLGADGIHGAWSVVPRRGFAEWVSAPARVLIDHWSEISAVAPIRRFDIDETDEKTALELARSPIVDQCIGVSVGYQGVKTEDIRLLGDAGVFRNALALHLGNTSRAWIDPHEAFDYFAASQCAPKLRCLWIDIDDSRKYKDMRASEYEYCWISQNYFDPREAAPEIEAKYGEQAWIYPQRQTPLNIVPHMSMY